MENDRVFALLLFGGSGWIVREWGEMMMFLVKHQCLWIVVTQRNITSKEFGSMIV
jgi:hypothetical protein